MMCIYLFYYILYGHSIQRWEKYNLLHLCIDNTKTTTLTIEAYIICWWDKCS